MCACVTQVIMSPLMAKLKCPHGIDPFPLGNGASRIFGGTVSDAIGIEKIMAIFFSLLGLALLTLVFWGHNPFVFVISVFLCGLLGGSPFALYLAMIGSYFGDKYATTKIGITQTPKVWAGLISGRFCGFLVAQTGSYRLPLLLVAVGTFAAAFFSHPRLMKNPGLPYQKGGHEIIASSTWARMNSTAWLIPRLKMAGDQHLSFMSSSTQSLRSPPIY
jgi:MFS family permease